MTVSRLKRALRNAYAECRTANEPRSPGREREAFPYPASQAVITGKLRVGC